MKLNFIIEKNNIHIIAIAEIVIDYIKKNIKESGEKGKELMERCSNCGRYPFCNKCTSPLGWCMNWIKRKLGGNND